MLRVSWRVCGCYVWLWYVCGLASIVIARFIVDSDERFDCSIGRAPLSYDERFDCSLGRHAVGRSAFAVEARFTLNRSTQIERSSVLSSMLDRRACLAYVQKHTRRSSKFKTAVSDDDRIGGAGLGGCRHPQSCRTPPIWSRRKVQNSGTR
jgi:heme exporter protein D